MDEDNSKNGMDHTAPESEDGQMNPTDVENEEGFADGLEDDDANQEPLNSPTTGDAIAQELLPISVETEMRRSYLDYAMSVIVGRALPDVRDGLKPVHRRVLYAMKEIGNTWNSPTKKAARVVGEVLGKYHPHGDSAAYQTIVRMAQDFSMRYPLVFGQGNFGSIDGDAAAAMRYTEVKLQKISAELLADLNEETVDFVPNFDNSEKEPVVLPTRVPQLLVNGASGIAVGMATNIPPHNLTESIDACLYALHHPECTVNDLIRVLPAPDFPTGGTIFGLSEVHQGYRTGRGRVVIRAKTHLEKFGRDRTRIVVDEIPYMVNKRAMYEKIHELWREKKLDGIAEMRDESTRKIRICIDLRQGASADVVLNNLFNLTQMQSSFSMNLVALVEGQPKTLNLKEMIDYFLAHRREVVTRRTTFRLRKSRDAGHLFEGQAVALDNLDEFIRLIRSARTVEEAQQALYGRGWPLDAAAAITRRALDKAHLIYPEDMDMERGLRDDGLYYLTKVQIDNILAMNLRRLTGLEREKVLGEYSQAMDRILDYLDILDKPERVTAIIDEELQNVKTSFGDERRSTIDIVGDVKFDRRDLLPKRDMVVTLTRDGFIKSQELADYNAQSRGGRGRQIQATIKDDEIEKLFIANTHDIIMCFTRMGQVYSLDVFDLPEGKSTARGRPIVNLIQLQEGDSVDFILPIQSFEEDKYLFFCFQNGVIKKSHLSLYRNSRRGLKAWAASDDLRLVQVALCQKDDKVLLFSDAGMANRMEVNEIRAMGRVTGGVRGMRLGEGAQVISMIVDNNDAQKTVMIATEHGIGKRMKIDDFTIRHRGGMGLRMSRSGEKYGKVVSAVAVEDTDEIMILSTSGNVIRTRANELLVYSRYAGGVRLIRLEEGEMIQAVRRVERTSDEPVDDEDIVHLNVEELDEDDALTMDDVEEEADELPEDELEVDQDDEVTPDAKA